MQRIGLGSDAARSTSVSSSSPSTSSARPWALLPQGGSGEYSQKVCTVQMQHHCPGPCLRLHTACALYLRPLLCLQIMDSFYSRKLCCALWRSCRAVGVRCCLLGVSCTTVVLRLVVAKPPSMHHAGPYPGPRLLVQTISGNYSRKSEVAHKWAWWLRNPCRLGGPHRFRARGQTQKWPTGLCSALWCSWREVRVSKRPGKPQRTPESCSIGTVHSKGQHFVGLWGGSRGLGCSPQRRTVCGRCGHSLPLVRGGSSAVCRS